MIINSLRNVKENPKPGPILQGYLTRPFKEDEEGWLQHVTRPLLKAGYRVTNKWDPENLVRYRGEKGLYLHEGSFSPRDDKPKAFWGTNCNCYTVDELYKCWAKRKAADPDFEPRLRSGYGLSKEAIEVFHAIFFDIDDGPKGPLDILTQIGMCDSFLARGLPYASIVGTGSMREGLDPVTPDCVPGKGIHGRIHFKPSTDRELHRKCTEMVIVLHNSDPACIDPGRRGRMGGFVAKHAGDVEAPWRIQSVYYLNEPEVLATLQEVHDILWRICQEDGHLDPHAEFEALVFCSRFKGCQAILRRRIKAAQERVSECYRVHEHDEYMRHSVNRDTMQRQLADAADLLVACRRSRRILDEALNLDKSVHKRSEYDPQPKQAGSGATCDADMPPAGVNDERVYAVGDDEPWDFDRTVWKHKDASGRVDEGTALELYEKHGNKSRKIVDNLLCPYCGKDLREGEATPTGRVMLHPDLRGGTACCWSCDCKVRSLRVRNTAGKSKSSTRKGCPAYPPIIGTEKARGRDGTDEKREQWVDPITELTAVLPVGHTVRDCTGMRHPPADMQLDRRVLLLALPHGMGKTEFYVRYAEAHPEVSMLVVVPTMNLSDHAFGRLNRPHKNDGERLDRAGFRLYSEETGGDLTCPRLVTCVDSLPRISYRRHYDVVVLEETHSIYGRFNDNIMRNRGAVWETMRHFMTGADHVILADGGLQDVDWLNTRDLIGTDDVQLVFAKANRRDVTVRVCDDFADIENLRRKQAEGRRTFTFCSSREDARTVFDSLPGDSNLLVCSKTSGQAAVVEFMRDPNTVVAGLGHLVASPSMGSGVDISTPHFEATFTFARGGLFTDAESVVQGFWRDRTTAERYLWPDDTFHGANEDPEYWRTTLTKEREAEIDKAMEIAAKFDFAYVRFAPQAVDDTLIEARVRMYVKRARSQNNLRAFVLGTLAHQGVKIRKVRALSQSTQRRITGAFSKHKKELFLAECEAVANARVIARETADRIERKRRCTEDERHQVSRSRIADVLGDDVDVTTRVVAEWTRGELREHVFRYVGVQAFLTGNGASYAQGRLDSYNRDPLRAEDLDVRKSVAISTVLTNVFGVTDLTTLGGATVSKPDSVHKRMLADYVEDPEMVKVLKFNRSALDRPLQQLKTLLGMCGIDSECKRERVKGTDDRVYVCKVDRRSADEMTRMTAHQRRRNEPHVEPDMCLHNDYVADGVYVPGWAGS